MQIFAGTKRQNKKQKPKQKTEANKALQRTKIASQPVGREAIYIDKLHCFPVSVAGRQERED